MLNSCSKHMHKFSMSFLTEHIILNNVFIGLLAIKTLMVFDTLLSLVCLIMSDALN